MLPLGATLYRHRRPRVARLSRLPGRSLARTCSQCDFTGTSRIAVEATCAASFGGTLAPQMHGWTARRGQILGWTAVSISVAFACLLAFWGSNENFHEGWYL